MQTGHVTIGTVALDSAATGDFYVPGNTGMGTTSPLKLLHVEDQTATSTLLISSGGSSLGGSIIFEDSDGAGCTELSFLNGSTTTATVTCPTGI